MIWYCKLELVYSQNKEYQRWSCKKEKKSVYFFCIWWIQIWIIWICGHFFWAGFWEIFRVSFFRGFRKKIRSNLKKKCLVFMHMREAYLVIRIQWSFFLFRAVLGQIFRVQFCGGFGDCRMVIFSELNFEKYFQFLEGFEKRFSFPAFEGHI